MTWTSDRRLAVAIRKGEIWLIEGADSNSKSEISYHRFASGLHEPLGLLEDNGSFLVAQRTEITRIRDLDGDNVADEYLREASGWNVSGSYHGYTYGPERDGDGQLWITTNIDMGDFSDNDAPWRGWGLTLKPDGGLVGQASGMRSPSGLGVNLEGDMFYCDQQGRWMPATPIHHLRPGAFMETRPVWPLRIWIPQSPKCSAIFQTERSPTQSPRHDTRANARCSLAPLQQSQAQRYRHTGHQPKRRFWAIRWTVADRRIHQCGGQPGLSRESERGLSRRLLSIPRPFPLSCLSSSIRSRRQPIRRNDESGLVFAWRSFLRPSPRPLERTNALRD